MTDIYDQATHQEEIWRDAAIEKARKAKPALVHGICNNCEASCVGAFCDKSCQEDFEARERMNKINGKG